ncbi:Glycosyl hydrolases family 16 [Chitinophaga sp. CF118]|uniref:glycoside hydrolase family 16 protein n=1 Tax=Chitinophaga sp. CF118 TaxID=1884367 RepID=UPI0008F0E9DB|nr:glycoside hydrolase family 16 protein [Chitinophaga sp. CF118]SFD18594.1 Glycosyl hydrolases family 16 [Chitinophaga sp. CF118]
MRKTIAVSILSCSVTAMLGMTSCTKDNKIEQKLTLPTTGIVKVNAVGICEYDQTDASILAQGYTKVYGEEFSTNLNNWEIWNSGAYNEELQMYKPANVTLADGKLVLTAKKETVTGATDPDNSTKKTFNYTSGRIESNQYFSASTTTPKVRFSARIKLAAGYGMWPAFWTYGDTWPTNGEIDILESQGQYPNVYTTDYWYGSKPEIPEAITAKDGAIITSSVNLTTCYHVYEAIWQKDTLTFLLDGKVVNTKYKNDTTGGGGFIPSFFGKKQRIALNAAVGGANFSNLDPSKIVVGTTYVDWVRVYTSK